ncbi:MAG: class IV adenylate cyclase [Planctomycetota bacterium]|jgi:adenylate cyclase class 2
MSHEIEAKIRVSSLEPIACKLKELAAEFLRHIQQVDTYFMDAAGQLRKNDCALRLRRQTIDNEQSTLITFKGARSDSKFKARAEYETNVGNAETAEKIFESLGYHKAIVVEKIRKMWSLDGCEVCLDELPRLGCFVEVEGPDEATITGVLEKLNLHNEPHITESYASMMAHTLKQE